jgi:hypothetical protein
MDLKKLCATAALAVAVGLGLSGQASATAAFSNPSLFGNYTFRASGFTADDFGDQGGINFTGVLTFNAAGGISAVDIQVTGGDDSNHDFFDCGAITSAPGSSYTVNSDGTGSFQLDFPSNDGCLPQDEISFTFALPRTSGGIAQINSSNFSTSYLFPGEVDGCLTSDQVFLSEPDECLTGFVLSGELQHQ